MSDTAVEYVLGTTIQYKGMDARVIRIIQRQDCIFEAEDGSPAFIQHESYVELKMGSGDIEFIVLYQEREAYTGPDSFIKAPQPIVWDGVNK